MLKDKDVLYDFTVFAMNIMIAFALLLVGIHFTAYLSAHHDFSLFVGEYRHQIPGRP